MAKTQRTDLLPRADAILDAAHRLLTRDGSRRLNVDEVARAAKVAKGTVYLHWRSREELLLAVGAREAAAMLDTVRAAIEADPAEAALHRYIRRHFLEATRRPILRSIFGGDQADLRALTVERDRSGTLRSKLIATRQYLAALDAHRLLRPGQDLDEVDYGLQAVAYGFFAAEPLLRRPGEAAAEPTPSGPGGPPSSGNNGPAESSPPNGGDAFDRSAAGSGPATDPDRAGVDHRADQLADIVRRSFEPARPPAAERLRAAAPDAVTAFTGLAGHFRRLAYGSAAD